MIALFGMSVDDPLTLAQTMLGIIIVCFYGGLEFLSNVFPISKLNWNFLIVQLEIATHSITTEWGTVKACDGNRTDQVFFKWYETVNEKPWLTKYGIVLLFDFVHYLKNFRNLWLLEKMGELVFDNNGVQRTAKLLQLKQLYELDLKILAQKSKLTEVSLFS